MPVVFVAPAYVADALGSSNLIPHRPSMWLYTLFRAWNTELFNTPDYLLEKMKER